MTMDMNWHNPPAQWSEENGITRIKTLGATDFWRHTHYGFVRDSGHFHYRDVSGDFSASVCVRGKYQTKYDQAGIMLRLDACRWIKAGIEVAEDRLNFCVVVTNEWSDWSLIPLSAITDDAEVSIHITRIGRTVTVRYCLNGGSARLARVAAFPYEETANIGIMCCSPEREGFEAEFREFDVGSPASPH